METARKCSSWSHGKIVPVIVPGCEAKFTAENALNNTSMQFMKPRSNCYSAQSVRLHISENRYLTRMITCGHFTC